MEQNTRSASPYSERTEFGECADRKLLIMQKDLLTRAEGSTGDSTLWRSKTAANARDRRFAPSAMATRRPVSFSSDVTPLSVMPHGTIRSKWLEVGADVEREAVAGDPPRDAHADRRQLVVADPRAGQPGHRGRR